MIVLPQSGTPLEVDLEAAEAGTVPYNQRASAFGANEVGNSLADHHGGDIGVSPDAVGHD